MTPAQWIAIVRQHGEDLSGLTGLCPWCQTLPLPSTLGSCPRCSFVWHAGELLKNHTDLLDFGAPNAPTSPAPAAPAIPLPASARPSA